MGCGPSSSKGRENYSTLSPDHPEPLTIPLVAKEEPSSQSHKHGVVSAIDPFATNSSSSKQQRTNSSRNPPQDNQVITAVVEVVSPRSYPTSFSTPSTPSTRKSPPPTSSTTKPTPTPSSTQLTLSAPYSASSRSSASPRTPTTTAIEQTPDTPPSPEPPSVVAPPTGSLHYANRVAPATESRETIPPPPLDLPLHNNNPQSHYPSQQQASQPLQQKQPSSSTREVSSHHQHDKKKKKRKSEKKSRSTAKLMANMLTADTPEPSSASGMRFEELYRLKEVLGTGAFSTVREGHHRTFATEKTYAVKCVNRKKLSEEDEAALLDEVAILKEMKHEHIIRLYDFFEEPTTYYLVMERMCGGELFDRIVAKAYYNEKEARDVCKILLEAVGHCHLNHVAHRDLKPENLLLLSEDDDSAVKIADFGFAKKVYERNSLTTQCGTPGYVAPEILEGIPYDERADMWSVGVILYILLGGYPPFIENNQRDLFRKIRRGEYEFHEEYWGTVSLEAKQLISQLLTVDPVTRLDAAQALNNPWIRGDDAALLKKDLGVNLNQFKKFNARRKFKAAVSTVMAVNKLQSLGKDFLKNLSEGP